MQAQIHEGGDVWFACVIQLCSQEINRLKKKPSKLRQRKDQEGKRDLRDGAETRLGSGLLLLFCSLRLSGLEKKAEVWVGGQMDRKGIKSYMGKRKRDL